MERWLVRAAVESDRSAIQDIEIRAGRRFAEVGLVEVAGDEPEAAATLHAFASDGGSLVAVHRPSAAVVGYVLFEELNGVAFVHQVSVAPEQQGQGAGRALLDVGDWARRRGLAGLALTTFDHHVPWNRPLYEHLGFRVAAGAALGGGGVQAIVAGERARGLTGRVVMTRPLESP